MKVVIDTNVVVSAMFFGGKPRKLLELLISHELEAYASPKIITKYHETLTEICKKYSNKPFILPINSIIASMKIIGPTSTLDVCRDSDDNKFLKCAIDSSCPYVISGDKDLLSLEKYCDIQILSVSDFFKQCF